ncbi:hypothetical protein ACFZDQ_10195, partial [Streptococcus suis]
LVCKISGEIDRSEAWDEARSLLTAFTDQKMQATQAVALRQKLADLEQRLHQQQNAERLLAEFNQKAQTQFETAEELEGYFEQQQARLEDVEA